MVDAARLIPCRNKMEISVEDAIFGSTRQHLQLRMLGVCFLFSRMTSSAQTSSRLLLEFHINAIYIFKHNGLARISSVSVNHQ